MRIIQRKANVREHNRQTKHKVADVRHHERHLKDKVVLGRIPVKDLSYPQAKKRYPFLNPNADFDKDGVVNKRDCKPFDVKRQDDDRQHWEGTEEQQRETDENISNILAKQRAEERGDWW